MIDFETFLADLRHPDEHLGAPDLSGIMAAGRRRRRQRATPAALGVVALTAVVVTFPIGRLAGRWHDAPSERPGSSIGSVVDPYPSVLPDPEPSPTPGPGAGDPGCGPSLNASPSGVACAGASPSAGAWQPGGPPSGCASEMSPDPSGSTG